MLKFDASPLGYNQSVMLKEDKKVLHKCIVKNMFLCRSPSLEVVAVYLGTPIKLKHENRKLTRGC